MQIKEALLKKRPIHMSFILVTLLFALFYYCGYKLPQPLERRIECALDRIFETQNVVAFTVWEENDTPGRSKYGQGFQMTPPNKLGAMNGADLYKLYLKLVEVPTFKCTSQKRYGNADDGGWEVCEQHPYTVTAPCLIHSWGVNWDFSFDDAISGKLGCNVHSFDPSMNTKSFNRSDKIIFHNYGIKGLEPSKHTTWNMKTFDQTLRDLNQEKSQIDYLKMDIEGDEWDVLTAMLDNENSFKHIRQVALEIHLNTCVKKFHLMRYVNILERMRQLGLELFHSHHNPLGYTSLVLGEAKSCCHEVYYVNTKYNGSI